MQNKTLKTIDAQLTLFHSKMVKIVRKWAKDNIFYEYNDSDSDSDVVRYYFTGFQDELADCIYDDSKNRWTRSVRKAAAECGMKFVGAGRSRIALEVSYYGKSLIVKVSVANEGMNNDKELKSIQGNLKVYPFVEKFMLAPLYYWKNKHWKTILAFPPAPIVKKGDWDPDRVENMYDLRDQMLPKKFVNENVFRHLLAVNTLFSDVHGHNIGFRDGLPLMIDVDCGSRRINLKKMAKLGFS